MTGAPATIGSPDGWLDAGAVREFVTAQLSAAGLDGRSVCVLVPDGTRACPLPLLISAIYRALHNRVSRLTVLVALGTRAPMSDQDLAAHLGCEPGTLADRYPGLVAANHAWWDDASLVRLGILPAARVAALSGGLLREPVPVRVNRAVTEHDVTLFAGPVLPHEVVGFSGGNKYFFPGVSGREFIDASHWAGCADHQRGHHRHNRHDAGARDDRRGRRASARRASGAVCGHRGRQRSRSREQSRGRASRRGRPACDQLRRPANGLGGPLRACRCACTSVTWMRRCAGSARSRPPIRISSGSAITCRDYFLHDWARFRHLHWGDLAHSTHLRGAGSYNPVNGERGRVTVTLAIGIPENVTRALNLDYLDPASIDPGRWAADPQTLVVPNAGETLYRLRGS